MSLCVVSQARSTKHSQKDESVVPLVHKLCVRADLLFALLWPGGGYEWTYVA
jgi:hypothetical protein